MWNTSKGKRVLAGAEAELFREGVGALLYWMKQADDELWETGVPVFDTLTSPERLAIIELVFRALLVKRVPCPPLTAVAEGAIAAVYRTILEEVQVEIDDEGGDDMRRTVVAACAANEYEKPPDASCKACNEWRDLVESLMDRVLWDRDWEVPYVKPDDSPKIASEIRGRAGISVDYYAAVPPDPNRDQLRRIKASLRQLSRHRRRKYG